MNDTLKTFTYSLLVRSRTIHILLLTLSLLSTSLLPAQENVPLLRANLANAQAGQYLVTAQNKNFSVLLVEKKEGNILDIHEITIPSQRIPKTGFSWKQWIEEGAQGNTSWLLFRIDIPSGTIQHTYSYTRNQWVSIPQTQNFISTLFNLNFSQIPDTERKRVGPSKIFESADQRQLWAPPMYVDGKKIVGVPFTAWRTQWPKDDSELSGKLVEVYIPQQSEEYPSYFPYWLQVSGLLGKARVHIIDSGNGVTLKKQ